MAKNLVKRYNVSVPKNYNTAQGETKTQWVNIGSAAMFDDGSIAIRIDALPVGQWDGTCNLFERVPQQTAQTSPQPQQPSRPAPAVNYPQSDMPFDLP